MKKLLVIISMFASLSASATNWIAPTHGASEYIDIDSMTYLDTGHTMRSAWLKIEGANGRVDLTRIEVYCPGRMIRYPVNHVYVNGIFVDTTYYNSTWDYVVPGSLAHNWSNTVCLNKVKAQ